MHTMLAPRDAEMVDTIGIFIEAVRVGNSGKVIELLDADPELANARSEAGDSAILLSLYAGCHEVTRLLLARGARLSAFEAAALGNLDRLKEHLAIDPRMLNAVSHDGWTLLHLSAFFGHMNIVEFLSTIGADLHAISKNGLGAMPIHSALTGQKLDIAEFLLQRGVDVNARQTILGYTPLHCAAAQGLTSAVHTLMQFGAEPHLRSEDGKTPLELATERNFPEIVNTLQAHQGQQPSR